MKRGRSPHSLLAFSVAVALACSPTDEENIGAPPEDEDASPRGDAGAGDTDPTPLDAAPPPAHGVRADYFDQFRDLRLTKFEPTPAVANGAAAPSGDFDDTFYSVRFSAKLEVAKGGSYRFQTTADDGVRVYLDDVLVIDDWVAHPTKVTEGKRDLPAGSHDLRVEWFQWDGGRELSLAWAEGENAFAKISEEVLTPLGTAPTSGGKALPPPVPTFSNPVMPSNCPDPGILSAPDPRAHFYMVCTGGAFPIRDSRNLVSWGATNAKILPGGKTAWSDNGGRNWAPEIHKVDNAFVAYFTAVNGADVLSIGAASAPTPIGPFTDRGSPLVENGLGVIDATFFEDDGGKRYLYYKIDGNSAGKPTPIYVRELAKDGLSFANGSTATVVLTNDAATWEGGVVEAPWVVKRQGTYYLFYSGNVYDYRYRTGVARASSPTGPFTKKGAPIMANNAAWVGPGHGSVIASHGTDYYFFHAWPAVAGGKNDTTKGRYGLLAPIVWSNGWPTFAGGTPPTGAMPVP